MSEIERLLEDGELCLHCHGQVEEAARADAEAKPKQTELDGGIKSWLATVGCETLTDAGTELRKLRKENELLASFRESGAPGSRAAIEKSCNCPVLDNSRGLGRGGMGFRFGWIINEYCPVHGSHDDE